MRRASALTLAAAVVATGCGKRRDEPHAAARAPRPAGPIAVPAATTAIPIDGEWETDWNDRAARVVLATPDGAEARPYSEVRFLRDRDQLLLGLYAADEDIRTSDRFAIVLGNLHFAIDSAAKLTPAIPGARTAVDLDEGTRDVPGDYDEEWKIELAIPIDALGAQPGASIPAKVSRCDTPKDGIVRCGAWSGAITLP